MHFVSCFLAYHKLNIGWNIIFNLIVLAPLAHTMSRGSPTICIDLNIIGAAELKSLSFVHPGLMAKGAPLPPHSPEQKTGEQLSKSYRFVHCKFYDTWVLMR